MKTLVTLFNILCLSAITISAWADVDREKTYSKTYQLGPDDEVSIENSFGEVNVQTWNRQEIKVDIIISATAKSDQIVDKMMDAIEIEDRKTSRGVSFRTEIGKINSKGKNNKQEFRIDYQVNLPAGQKLDLACSFGEIIMPDYAGEIDLTSKFGSLEAGKLSDPGRILVEFGKVDVEAMQGGDAVIKFSTGSIDQLSGDVELDVEFCGDMELSAGDLERLDVEASNSTVTLQVPRDFSANYTIYTNFGSFKNSTEFDIEDDDDGKSFGPDFDTEYRGTSGSGRAEVVMDGSFSKIRLEH